MLRVISYFTFSMENKLNYCKLCITPNTGVVCRVLQSNESFCEESISIDSKFRKASKTFKNPLTSGRYKWSAKMQVVYGFCPTKAVMIVAQW